MGLFFGRETRAAAPWIPEPAIPPFLGANMSGSVDVSSSPTTALTVPAVWACVSLLAGAVSSLPLETFRKSVDPVPGQVPKRITDPPLVTSPDDEMTQSEWLHMLMVSLLLRGNAIGMITARDYDLRPKSVKLLNPDDVRMSVDRAGKLIYKMGTGDVAIPSQDVWHVRGLTLPGARIGLSPISYAAAVLGIDLSSRQFANQFFDGGGIPKAVLESDQQVTQEQARTIKDRVMATFRGRDPLVLGLGLKYTQIQVNPEEAQFLGTQQANVAQIARYFGIPAAMIDGPSGGGMTYSNTEQRGIEFLTYSLAPWLKRVEDAMFTLLPGQQYVRFNTQQLLRTDAETQAKIAVQYLAGKVLTPTEIRATLGLDPMTQKQKDEVALVPLDITAIGGARINKQVATGEDTAAAGTPDGEPTPGSAPPTPAPKTPAAVAAPKSPPRSPVTAKV
ncbi:MAG: phage portal protein [Mycobacteriales bacterium]